MAQQPSPTAIPNSNSTSPFPPAHPSAETLSLYEPDRRKSTLLATLIVQHCVLPSGYGAAITHVWIRNDGLFTCPCTHAFSLSPLWSSPSWANGAVARSWRSASRTCCQRWWDRLKEVGDEGGLGWGGGEGAYRFDPVDLEYTRNMMKYDQSLSWTGTYIPPAAAACKMSGVSNDAAAAIEIAQIQLVTLFS